MTLEQLLTPLTLLQESVKQHTSPLILTSQHSDRREPSSKANFTAEHLRPKTDLWVYTLCIQIQQDFEHSRSKTLQSVHSHVRGWQTRVYGLWENILYNFMEDNYHTVKYKMLIM